MKKTSLSLILVLALISTICILSCRPEEEQSQLPQDCPPGLPCATQTGANTFGCYINGAAWVAGLGPNVFAPELHKLVACHDEDGTGGEYGRYFSVSAWQVNDTINGYINMQIEPVLNTGIIDYASSKFFEMSGNMSIKKNGQLPSNLSFRLDTLFEHNIEITYFDIEKNIISGKFSFTGTSSNDTVKITDGRFDVVYDQY